jgi:hypothetical protein
MQFCWPFYADHLLNQLVDFHARTFIFRDVVESAWLKSAIAARDVP